MAQMVESACNAGYLGSIPGQEYPLGRKWQYTSVFLPGEFHGLGYTTSPRVAKSQTQLSEVHLIWTYLDCNSYSYIIFLPRDICIQK